MRRFITITAIVALAALALAATTSDEVVTAETGIDVEGRSSASILADGGTAIVYLTAWKDTIFTAGGDTLPRTPSRDTLKIRYVRELVPRDVFWSSAWDSVDTLWIVPTGADTVIVTPH